MNKVQPDLPTRPPEEIVAESTAHCRESGRLTWVMLNWLIRHIEQVDERRLLQKTQETGDLSVLGVLCDIAQWRNPHLKFERIIRACNPSERIEIFFYRVAQSPLASRLSRENALQVFRRWNYLCNELRYLE